MRKALLLLAVWPLCFSYSEAYDQQYQIGDTGPNGGIITSVDVDTVLTNTTTELVGGFEEQTDYYSHTETIIEEVNETITSTVTETIETITYGPETTTSNTVCYGCSNMRDISGGVLDHNTHVHYDYRGGTVSGTVALSDYLTQQEINNGFTVNAGADVNGCLNRVGNTGCSDTTNPMPDIFRITISVTDGTSVYTSTTQHSIDWYNQYRTVSAQLDVPSNGLSELAVATLDLYGQDAGFWAGWYGPVALNAYMTFTYDPVQVVMQEIERQIQETITSYVTTELISDSSELTRTYVGDPVQDAVSVVQTPTVEPVQVEIKVTSQDTVTATVKTTSPSGEQKTETMEIKVTEMKMEKMESKDSGGQKQSGQKSKSKSGGGSYNAAMESVKVAIMAQSEASQQFDAYQAKSLPSVPFYAPVQMEGGTNYDNPYGRWISGASDAVWNDMVESQWQR